MKKFYHRLEDRFKKVSLSILVPCMIFLFMFASLSQRIVIIIPAGHAGVFWSLFFGGTRINQVYPEGINFILPYNKMYIYNVRIQEVSPLLKVLTKRGLEVRLYLSIRYAPEYKLVGILHKKVGPDYVNKVIIPEIESVLREVIGTMDAEEIYTTGREVITKAIDEAIEQVAQRYIVVDDVIIRRIELPEMVAETIRYKLKQKHLIEAHQFIVEKEKKEAERKRIEGKGIRDQLSIIASADPPDQKILEWMGIKATLELSKSKNSKVVIIGAGKKGLPLIGNVPLDSYVNENVATEGGLLSTDGTDNENIHPPVATEGGLPPTGATDIPEKTGASDETAEETN